MSGTFTSKKRSTIIELLNFKFYIKTEKDQRNWSKRRFKINFYLGKIPENRQLFKQNKTKKISQKFSRVFMT